MPSDVSAAQVMAAVRECLAEAAGKGEEPPYATFAWRSLLKKKLGMEFATPNRFGSGRDYSAEQRLENSFDGQVMRALVKLTRDGTLVKRGRGNDVQYCTPAGAKAAEERELAEQQAQADRNRRRSVIREQLSWLGIEETGRTGYISFDLEGYEVLVALALKGRFTHQAFDLADQLARKHDDLAGIANVAELRQRISGGE